MPSARLEIGLLRSTLELLGIVLIRFRPVQRIWGAWLVGVNSAGVAFIGRIEAQVALAAVAVALLLQALIYRRKRFIRLLGLTHLLWLPMIAWMLVRLQTMPAGEGGFRAWLVALIITNATCLLIDAWDATRFARGERAPYYVW